MTTTTDAHERRKAGAPVSVQAMRWAMRQRAGSPTAKAVLLVLAEHADKDGLAWPSQRTIAEEAECNQRSVRRHLEALAARELVSVLPGAGRGSSRYQLPVVRRSDASQDAARSEASSASLRGGPAVRSEAPKRLTSDDRSEASENRSEALDHRSEATRVSDQHKQKQNHYVEPNYIEPAAPPPPARTRTHASAREHPTPADLDATATSPTGYRLVATWAAANPGVANGHRRELARAVDQLLAQRADPALIPAALDAAHGSNWRSPVKALPMAYEDVRRAAANTSRPAHTEPGTSSQRANAILALRKGPRS